MNYLKLFSVMFMVFIIIDLIWLGVIAKSFYHSQLAGMITNKFNWPAAILFYFIFISGMIYFVVIPTSESTQIYEVIIKGAIFGLVTYATYDLTNLATLKNWPIWLSIVDILWGIVLSTAVSITGHYYWVKL